MNDVLYYNMRFHLEFLSWIPKRNLINTPLGGGNIPNLKIVTTDFMDTLYMRERAHKHIKANRYYNINIFLQR